MIDWASSAQTSLSADCSASRSESASVDAPLALAEAAAGVVERPELHGGAQCAEAAAEPADAVVAAHGGGLERTGENAAGGHHEIRQIVLDHVEGAFQRQRGFDCSRRRALQAEGGEEHGLNGRQHDGEDQDCQQDLHEGEPA